MPREALWAGTSAVHTCEMWHTSLHAWGVNGKRLCATPAQRIPHACDKVKEILLSGYELSVVCCSLLPLNHLRALPGPSPLQRQATRAYTWDPSSGLRLHWHWLENSSFPLFIKALKLQLALHRPVCECSPQDNPVTLTDTWDVTLQVELCPPRFRCHCSNLLSGMWASGHQEVRRQARVMMESRMGLVPVSFVNLTQPRIIQKERLSEPVSSWLEQAGSLQVCLWGIVLFTY